MRATLRNDDTKRNGDDDDDDAFSLRAVARQIFSLVFLRELSIRCKWHEKDECRILSLGKISTNKIRERIATSPPRRKYRRIIAELGSKAAKIQSNGQYLYFHR